MADNKAPERRQGEKRKTGGFMYPPTPTIPRLTIEPHLPFLEQVDRMISQAQRSRRETENIPLVLEDIKLIFRQIVPNVEPLLFGSSLTNLALHGGDLDVFLYCPDGQPENLINEAKSVFRKSGKFKMILFLLSTRIPLIKATHFRTNLKVDISAVSLRGVNNSHLLHHIVKRGDPRIRPFLIFLNWWGKRWNLVKTGLISSFCLNIMAIFYLQYGCPPWIVPPIHTITELTSGFWPVHFKSDPLLLVSKNTQSLQELIVGFFQFYSNFDFSNFVICPFHGEPVSVEDFLNPSQLPESFGVYKEEFKTQLQDFVFRSPLKKTPSIAFIQEPFELEHNLARYMDEGLRTMLQLALSIASSVLSTTNECQWIQLLFNDMPLFSSVRQRVNFVIDFDKEIPFWKVATACERVFKDIYLLSVDSFHTTGSSSNKLIKLDTSSMEAYLKLSGDPSQITRASKAKIGERLKLKLAVGNIISAHFGDLERRKSNKYSDCASCVFHICRVNASKNAFVAHMYDVCSRKKGRFKELASMRLNLKERLLSVLQVFDSYDQLRSLVQDLIKHCPAESMTEFEAKAQQFLKKRDKFSPLLSK